MCRVKLVNDTLSWSIDDYKDTLYNINLNYTKNIVLNSKLKSFEFVKEQIEDIEELKFYDFTVDKYENMLIPIYNDPTTNTIEFIIAHNSTYDTVVNLVNRGFAIGQGNFGYNAVKPVAPAAYRYCVTGDTLIPTSNGIYRIDELENHIPNIYINDINGWSKAKAWINSGKDKLIKITTKRGYELVGNYNHPVVIEDTHDNYNIWKELKDLKIGDKCLINLIRRVNTVLPLTKLDKVDLFIIGLFYNYQLYHVVIVDKLLKSDIDNFHFKNMLFEYDIQLDSEDDQELMDFEFKNSCIYSICKQNIDYSLKRDNIVNLLNCYLPTETNTMLNCLRLTNTEFLSVLCGMFIGNIKCNIDENNTLSIELISKNKDFFL